jgi:hypothetical protein
VPYAHFTDAEAEGLDPALVEKLDVAREIAGVPFVITSGLRPGDEKSHGRGKAVDIGCVSSRDRMKIVHALIIVGFRRIGVYDKHVHADVDDLLPQDVLWWGVSKSTLEGAN